MFISGIITALLLVLLLAGFTGSNDPVKKAIRQGNMRYESAAYDEALEFYEAGLSIDPDDKALNFNAAQAAYILGDFGKAVEYYEKSGDYVEKYLNTGNTFFVLGNSLEDNEQKLQCYLEALKYYYDGIVLFPQNVPLKYNYEVVKALADDILDNMEPDNSDQSDSNDDSDSDESQEQDGQNQEGSSGEQDQDEASDEQNQGEASNEQDQDEASDEQSQGEASDEQDQDENSAEQAQSQDGQDNGEDAGSAQEQDEGQEGAQDANSQDVNVYELDQEAIERILRMLEIQEQENLKNNQEVVGGKNGKKGW